MTPGNCSALSSSAIRPSGVRPGRHSAWSFSTIVVSSIERGAGSVAVSARPTLPNTDSTSGKLRMILSVCWTISRAFPIDTPGRVVGM